MEWTEEHSYDDPSIATPALRSWLPDMTQTFPNLQGPDVTDDDASIHQAWYTIGRYVIYIDFRWSVAAEAYETVYRLTAKHQIGFFDVSTDTDIPAILLPQNGVLQPLAEVHNLAQVVKKP